MYISCNFKKVTDVKKRPTIGTKDSTNDTL